MEPVDETADSAADQTTVQQPSGGIDPLAFLLASTPAPEPSDGVTLDGASLVPVNPQHGILDLDVHAPTSERSRSPLEPIALVLAVLVAPLGLIAGIVASVLSHRRVGYVTGLARGSVIVAAVMCVVLAGGGVAYSFYARSQAHEAALRAGSAAMCAELATKPGILADPAFGWPSLTSTIPAYVADVTAYEKWWSHLAAVAPKQIRSQVVAVDTVAKANANRMAVSRVVNHDEDYADLQKIASASTLPAWVTTYCN